MKYSKVRIVVPLHCDEDVNNFIENSSIVWTSKSPDGEEVLKMWVLEEETHQLEMFLRVGKILEYGIIPTRSQPYT